MTKTTLTKTTLRLSKWTLFAVISCGIFLAGCSNPQISAQRYGYGGTMASTFTGGISAPSWASGWSAPNMPNPNAARMVDPTIPRRGEPNLSYGRSSAQCHSSNAAASAYMGNAKALWNSNHPRVQKFREHYRRTQTVKVAMQRAEVYLPYITKVFCEEGLPLELSYLPLVESLYDTRANSGVALGMWQFTRQTARHMGMKVSTFKDERLNWQKSSVAAAKYLKQLGKRFNYDWSLAIAAYNGGPGYMEKQMKKQGTRDFFRLRIREETFNYVPRFVGMLQVARERNPQQLVAALK